MEHFKFLILVHDIKYLQVIQFYIQNRIMKEICVYKNKIITIKMMKLILLKNKMINKIGRNQLD